MLATLAALSFLGPPRVTLMAVGDVMLERHVGRYIDRYGAGYPFVKVGSTLKQADVVFANLECPLTKRDRELRKRFVFRVPPSRVRALLLGRPTVLSLANNHTLDCGRAGLKDTMETLDHAGLSHCGAGENPDSAWMPTILSVGTIRIAFLAFSDFSEYAVGREPAVAHFDEALARAAISEAKRHADVVVVAAHWGVEGSDRPSGRQRSEARILADAGADLILGSHPHVVQPVEWLTCPDGRRTCVAYSMGDFVFDTVKPSECRTGIFRFVIGGDGVVEFKLIPAAIREARPEMPQPQG